MITDNQWYIKPNRERALMLAKREITSLVHDAVELEGIHFTLPEIQTLLDGVTVGGHKLSDQKIAVNQGNGWRSLFSSVEEGRFKLTQDYVCSLHAVAAREEALEWGKFRSGSVTIAGTPHMPPPADELPQRFAEMISGVAVLDDIYDQAICVFLTMSREQFFYDVNKRMGRFIMNGLLLEGGYPVINLPARRQLEFNQLMLSFYESGEQPPMNRFMRSCLDERLIKIMQEP